ncbi:MAG: membrane protein insertion efficiency factor YidD [Dehalococcoidia bacterium]
MQDSHAAIGNAPRRRSVATRFALRYIESYRARMPARLRPRCRFEPSCSEYGLAVYERYGFVRATAKTVWRLLRCNPFRRASGMIDRP